MSAYSKAEVIADVKSHCYKCAGKSTVAMRECRDKSCSLWKYSHEPAQLQLFGPHEFEVAIVDVCKTMPTIFRWDGLRNAVLRKYPGLYIKPQWWGSVAQRAVLQAGYKRFGYCERVPTPRGHGNKHYVYRRTA